MTTRFALGISYDGTNYHGWQRQGSPQCATIQTLLEEAISRVADHPISVICAGRTDKGVHALGQVVHFDSTAQRSERGWLLGINTHLPADIRVTWVQPMEEGFHARYSASARRYCYVIYNHTVASALLRHQTTWYHKPLDEQKMSEAGQYLLGEHDFSSYRAVACQAHSPVRIIYHLTVTRREQFIFMDIKANGFLHHMVRNIAGTLMAIGSGTYQPEWTKEILQAKDRTQAEVTASPCGLYFMEVDYPEKFAVPKNNNRTIIF